jgi:hypothetical protein
MTGMRNKSVVWDWANAGRCALCALPAALVIVAVDATKGLAWAIGILPAAIVGMAPQRRDRSKLVMIGALFAVSIAIGSLISQTALLAILGIFLIAYGSAVLASRVAFGALALALCAPVAAVGLSYTDLSEALALGLIMFAGSVWSYLVFLLWAERPATPKRQAKLLPRPFADTYGILLGLAAASSAAVGEAIHTDHVGWATAAAMFVMRPKPEMQQLRSVGRVVSVFVGALAAVVFVRTGPPAVAVAVAAIAAIAGVGGTRTSRWYVSPLFSTFLVLTLLLYSDATSAQEQWRFNERVGETVLGVAFA